LHWLKSTSVWLLTVAMLYAVIISCIIGCAGVKPKEEVEYPPVVPIAPTEAVVSHNGMIVCAHPIAAEVGLQVLERGGNAVDAAVAALLALNVVEPQASGLGGGGFMGIHMADKEPVFLNYREKAPKAVDPNRYYTPEDSDRVAMQKGATAICVPGSPKAYAMVWKRYGTMDIRALIDPAMGLAHGTTVSKGMSELITAHFEDILADSSLASVFLNDSLPLQQFDNLTQLSLANTFSRLRINGFDYFYDSSFCKGIVDYLQEKRSPITMDDVTDYSAKWVLPLTGSYRGYQIVTAPPPTAGGLSLIEVMNILETYDIKSYQPGSAELIHIMAEAMKQAYSDYNTYVTDPDYEIVPQSILLSKDYARNRAAEIPANEARKLVAPYEMLGVDDGNTTHLVVIDVVGNIVSATQSLNYFFGSAVMIPGYGVIMNNEMADFDWKPGQFNSIEGGKRPRSNMCPTIVYDDGKPFLIIGTPGAARITSAMAEILVNIIDFGMTVTEAIDAPRFHPVREHLVLENRFPPEVLDSLSAMGYVLHLTGPLDVYFGGAHAILVDRADGSLHGGADPRRDGKAMGY